MALSDYLTPSEWDGFFYLFCMKKRSDLGAAMTYGIECLLEKGYHFKGLDEQGNKKKIVTDENGDKLAIIFFGATNDKEKEVILKSLLNGRKFIKKHASELLTQTDEEWNTFINDLNEPIGKENIKEEKPGEEDTGKES